MSLYFLVHNAEAFERLIRPALTASWRERSFAPCQGLGDALAAQFEVFAERYHMDLQESIVWRAGRGLSFDRSVWRLLAGELLLVGARRIPEIQTAPEALCRLLAPELLEFSTLSRSDFVEIHQVLFGSRDLTFGAAFYRSDQAGWNDQADVVRLAGYLQTIDSAPWKAEALAGLPGIPDEEEQSEELQFAREWFPALRELYRQAEEEKSVIICERIEGAGRA
jgi:hypothetical protein